MTDNSPSIPLTEDAEHPTVDAAPDCCAPGRAAFVSAKPSTTESD